MPDPRDEHLTETRRDVPSEAGVVIGPYHLLQLIGQGGMGEVWLAEQKEPVRRRVALKLIKAGMDTREVVARFQSERQALALMDHPCIAKVFDAGTTSQGLPYFVMEYVAGMPITDYCDKHKMNTEARLALFTHVCEGVQHAHQKAIIHRDLKPSNILVTEVDGKPVPRIIDFGIAKATAQRLTAETMFTRMGAIVGTPGYMSPEQADSAGEDVDTRTDVYSLGVVLYELLVGALPLDFRKLAFDEVLRKLRDQDAPKPSTRLKSSISDSSLTAENRATHLPDLVRELRGDLDAISLKAIEKDRARRYGSPSELASDIYRYLGHEPIQARPSSARYRIGKYVRRHRVGVAAASLVVLLLLASGVAQTLTLRRVMRERDRADRITEFLTKLFVVQNPSETRGNQVTARQILDKGAENITKGLAKDPELSGQLMQVMGNVYRNLGVYSRAESLLRQAVGVRKKHLGENNPATLSAMSDLASMLEREGKYPEAKELCTKALAEQQKLLGPDDRRTLDSMTVMGRLYYADGRNGDAEKMFRHVEESDRKLLGPEDPVTVAAATQLAYALRGEGRLTESAAIFREAVDFDRRTLGPDHPQTLNAMTNYANTLADSGDFAQSEKMAREVLAIRERVLGKEHPDTLWAITSLETTLNNEGKYSEVIATSPGLIEALKRTVGPDHTSVVQTETQFGAAQMGVGDYSAAEKTLQEAYKTQVRATGPADPDVAWTLGYLAVDLAHQNRFAEADEMTRRAVEITTKALGADSPYTAESVYRKAAVTALEGNKDGALAMLRHAFDHGLSPSDYKLIETDPEFRSLHGDPKFNEFIAEVKKRHI